MTEFNAFLEEWKEIKTTQKEILEVSKRNYSKTLKWCCGAVLLIVFGLGFSLSIFILNFHTRKTVRLLVNSPEECMSAKGHWQKNNGKTGDYCIFDFPK